MSKNILKYQETRLIKSRKKKGKGWLVLLMCIVMVGGVIMLSSTLSGALTVGNFGFNFSSSALKVKAHSYYAVTMGEYDTLNEAETVASGTSVMGAGSYIWNTDKKYVVIGNVYDNLEDAKKVKDNITDTNYNIGIREIKYKKVNCDLKELTKEQRTVIKSNLNYINELYDKCYNYSIKYDKGEIVATVVSSELNSLNGNIKVNCSRLDSINSVTVIPPTLKLKNAYVAISNEIDSAVLKVIQGSSTNRDLKYLTTSIAIIKYNLYEQL